MNPRSAGSREKERGRPSPGRGGPAGCLHTAPVEIAGIAATYSCNGDAEMAVELVGMSLMLGSCLTQVCTVSEPQC